MHAEQPNQNGRLNGDDSEMADAESGEDMDDDMMDKISSSPSISDGGYFSHARPLWPCRSSSFQLPTPPFVQTPPRHCTSVAETRESDASSPFLNQPAHLPLSHFFPSNQNSQHAPRSGLVKSQSRPNTPSELSSDSSSPFTSPPAHYPLHFPSSPPEVQSEVHHRLVEYHASPTTAYDRDEGFEDSDELEDERRDTLGPLFSEAKIASWNRLQERDEKECVPQMFQQPQLVKSASDIELERQLLPLDDPLLRDDDFDDSCTSHVAVKLDDNTFDNDDDAWETESDRHSKDSWNSADFLMQDDDDSEELLFPTDDRFIDSGWGGECLREIEDIDFEFVYALHTFVATVEGQANAQKGDTMVLLDDSNSYWWLVRVVKDSTIGEFLSRLSMPGILIRCRLFTR
jgi:hypothetical protein